jgi:hypothetical protein
MNNYYDEPNPANDMYYEDGRFKPLTASYGNISGDIEHYRNTYMEAEKEYFTALLDKPNIREEFSKYVGCSTDELFETAMDYQRRLEYGELETKEQLLLMKYMTPEERDDFHMRNLEMAEQMLCLLLAAIRDKALILELVYRPHRRRR